MIKKILSVMFFVSVIFSVGACSNSKVENSVKIQSISVNEESITPLQSKKEHENNYSRNVSLLSNTDEKTNANYAIIYRSQTDITFTIKLDNPEAYSIDDIRITCDDRDSKIWLSDTDGSGAWKPIQREDDGTWVVGWGSSDRYERTYKIRTTSEDVINSFKVVDVRLAGHEKFQSKETKSTDLGNNELKIYKMDDDAYTLNVFEKKLNYSKFNVDTKDTNISNIKVNGKPSNEDGYWITERSIVEISYDYYLSGNDLLITRTETRYVEMIEFLSGDFNASPYGPDGNYSGGDFEDYDISITLLLKGNPDIDIKIDDKDTRYRWSGSVDYGVLPEYDEGTMLYTFCFLCNRSVLDSILSTNNSFHTKNDAIEFLNKITVEINGIKYKFEIEFFWFSTDPEFPWANPDFIGLKPLEA